MLNVIEEILLQETREQTEEILPQKMGEQTVNICSSADMHEYPSDTDVGEQEVTQPSEHGKKEKASQRLRRPETIQKSNPKYVKLL